MKYRCPKCKVVAEIDKATKQFNLIVDTPTFSFPKHSDCELAKPIADINTDELEVVE